MPIFEYRCDSCNHTFSVLTRVLSQPVTLACPVCAGTLLHKLVSRFSVSRSEKAILDELAQDSDAACDIADAFGEEIDEDMEGCFSELLASDPDGGGWEDDLGDDQSYV